MLRPGPGWPGAIWSVDIDYRTKEEFTAEAIDALGIDEYHLIVHDAGGPIGFQALHALEAVLSLTVLNTLLSMDHAPFPGEIYGRFSSRFQASSPHRVFVSNCAWPASPTRPCC